MNKREKEIQQVYLNNEKAVLKKLEGNYKDALAEINSKIEILMARQDADMQHVIYQVEYQKALKTQVQAILETLQANEFETVSEYLAQSYEDGFIGTMYNLQGQGIPLVFPIDQEQVATAIQHETKLSESLYTALGKDVVDLRKKIAGEISRGLATGMMYSEISRNIAGWARIPKNNAMRIARTEMHRIQTKATMDACYKAKDNGAEVMKQWDAVLDAKTRPSHVRVDGEIRKLNEKFSNGLRYPGDPNGKAGEVINCRCGLNQRAKWLLEANETKYLGNVKDMTDKQKEDIAKKLNIPVDELERYSDQIVPLNAKSYKEFKDRYNELWHYEGSKLQEEAEARIAGYAKKKASKQNGKTMKIEFPNDVLKVNGVTEDVKSQLNNSLKKLESEYNIKLNGIYIEPAGKGDVFVTGYHDGVMDMVVNANADFEKIIQKIPAKYESGYFAGKSLEDYLAHEMAHVMLFQDCKTDAEYYAKEKQIQSLYEHLKGISRYADKTGSGNEALAEAFVRVRNGEEVPPIAKILVESYFGKWKK